MYNPDKDTFKKLGKRVQSVFDAIQNDDEIDSWGKKQLEDELKKPVNGTWKGGVRKDSLRLIDVVNSNKMLHEKDKRYLSKSLFEKFGVFGDRGKLNYSVWNRRQNVDMTNVLNVSSGTETSIKKLSETICTLIDSPLSILEESSEVKNYNSNILLDISKIEKLYKWKPKYTLQNALKEILNL